MNRMRVMYLVAAAIAACASDPNAPPPGVTYRVEANEYAPGESVRVTLINSSRATLTFGSIGCSEVMERRAGDVWVIADPDVADGIACDAASYGMAPGQRATREFASEDWMVPGEYRFRRGVRWPAQNGRGYMLVSDTFRIREG